MLAGPRTLFVTNLATSDRNNYEAMTRDDTEKIES